ncbi:MAG: hypothetical protein ACKVQJ_01900 [Pyrinomonadaceae bacterium]
MLLYVLIGLSLVLVGVAGLQFSYMFYLDRLHIERKKYIHSLEQKCARLKYKLEAAERRVTEQEILLQPKLASGGDDEAWAELIDER